MEMKKQADIERADVGCVDVVIVGASVAGASAAILLARYGLNILVIDKKNSDQDYKATCTTFIQPSALPVIKKIGIKEELDGLRAIKNSAVFWTPYGWVRDTIGNEEQYKHGYSVQRKKLDPLILAHAQQLENVTVKLGCTLDALNANAAGDYKSLTYVTNDGERTTVNAKLIVIADGRTSTGAKLASVPTTPRQNNRFVYFAYYKNMPLRSGQTAQFWQKGSDMGFAYPFDDELTMLCSFVTHDKHDAWAGDKFSALEDFFKDLPEPPDQTHAERASKMYGMRRLKDYKRPPVHRNLALIGDACMAPDPLSGAGCGFAMQASDLLASALGPALANGEDTAKHLKAFKRAYQRSFSSHEYFIQNNSSGRPMDLMERLIARAAVSDAHVAHQLHLFVARIIPWNKFFSPANIGRIFIANFTYAFNRKYLSREELA